MAGTDAGAPGCQSPMPAAETSPNVITLRSLVSEETGRKFAKGGVADQPVDRYEIEYRLAAVKVAIVAHDSLGRRLSQVDAAGKENLLDSLDLCQKLGLVDGDEAKVLRGINKNANDAKHGRAITF